MRGENISLDMWAWGQCGTSPRARGKRKNRDRRVRGRGNIPACAGKTLMLPNKAGQSAEHPRVRGENHRLTPWLVRKRGTSPRARGKRVMRKFVRVHARNIPACAGKTAQYRPTCNTVAEHPRVRGENQKQHTCYVPTGGTSPRARGKPNDTSAQATTTRNIPACAGKTVVGGDDDWHWEEHPRVRGENPPNPRPSSAWGGTSPRARGKHLLTCGSSFLRVILHSILFFCTVGVPWNPPCSSRLSECFSARIVVYGQLGTSLLSAYGCAFWWDGG